MNGLRSRRSRSRDSSISSKSEVASALPDQVKPEAEEAKVSPSPRRGRSKKSPRASASKRARSPSPRPSPRASSRRASRRASVSSIISQEQEKQQSKGEPSRKRRYSKFASQPKLVDDEEEKGSPSKTGTKSKRLKIVEKPESESPFLDALVKKPIQHEPEPCEQEEQKESAGSSQQRKFKPKLGQSSKMNGTIAFASNYQFSSSSGRRSKVQNVDVGQDDALNARIIPEMPGDPVDLRKKKVKMVVPTRTDFTFIGLKQQEEVKAGDLAEAQNEEDHVALEKSGNETAGLKESPPEKEADETVTEGEGYARENVEQPEEAEQLEGAEQPEADKQSTRSLPDFKQIAASSQQACSSEESLDDEEEKVADHQESSPEIEVIEVIEEEEEQTFDDSRSETVTAQKTQNFKELLDLSMERKNRRRTITFKEEIKGPSAKEKKKQNEDQIKFNNTDFFIEKHRFEQKVPANYQWNRQKYLDRSRKNKLYSYEIEQEQYIQKLFDESYALSQSIQESEEDKGESRKIQMLSFDESVSGFSDVSFRRKKFSYRLKTLAYLKRKGFIDLSGLSQMTQRQLEDLENSRIQFESAQTSKVDMTDNLQNEEPDLTWSKVQQPEKNFGDHLGVNLASRVEKVKYQREKAKKIKGYLQDSRLDDSRKYLVDKPTPEFGAKEQI